MPILSTRQKRQDEETYRAMIHWIRFPLACVVPVHLCLRSKTDDELVPTSVVCEPSNKILPWSIGLDFRRVPLIRHSHILIVIVKHVDNKDVRPVQLVAVRLFTSCLCLLQPKIYKTLFQSKLTRNYKTPNTTKFS